MQNHRIVKRLIILLVFVVTCAMSSSVSAYYSARNGRFLSRDPARYHDGPNGYEYVGGRPANAVDPYGLVAMVDGSTACRETPANGLQWVNGRGAFTSYSILPSPEPTKTSRVGALTILSWTPNAKTFTHGCQCCDEIGFIQIAETTVTNAASMFAGTPSIGSLAGYWNSWDWFIDGGIPYPYGGQTTGDPVTGAKIRLEDAPGIYTYNTIGKYWLKEFQFKAHTCAVCLKGIEGPNDATNALTVYGCISWGFKITLRERGFLGPTRDDYDHYAYIGELTSGPGPRDEGYQMGHGPYATGPSAEFKKLMAAR